MKKLNWNSNSPFDATTIEDVPEKKGVYLLWTKESNEKKISYIGKAKNLKERFLQHLSPEETNNLIKNNLNNICNFSYAEVKKKKDRKGIELHLYNKFRPKFNQISPEKDGVNQIEVNIPKL